MFNFFQKKKYKKNLKTNNDDISQLLKILKQKTLSAHLSLNPSSVPNFLVLVPLCTHFPIPTE